MPLLLLIFIIVPLAEIAVFIKVGEAIGLGATIAIVIITAIIGAALLRAQGFSTMQRAQAALSAGRIPVESVIDGASLLTAGAFLLTPGMITDTLGFLLFVPAFRHWLAKWAFRKMMGNANIDVSVFGRQKSETFDDQPPPTGQGPVIDVEYERVKNPDSDIKNGNKT